MPNVTFDGVNRIIQVNAGVSELNADVDLYSDWKEWVLQGDNSKYPQAFRTVGGDPLAGTSTLGRFYFLMNNWKIKTHPSQTDELLIVGNVFTEDGSNLLTQSVPIVRQNVSALTYIETVSGSGGGGGGLTPSQDTKLTSIYVSQSNFDVIITSMSFMDADLNYLIASGSTGSAGGGLTPAQETMLTEVFRLLGLDPSRPVTVTPVLRTVGSEVTQSISTSGQTVIVTRLP